MHERLTSPADRKFELDNELAQIPRFAGEIEAFCASHGVAPADIYKINLALDELLTNIVSYAFDDGGPHQIRVAVALRDDRFEAVLCDDGRPFDPLTEVDAAVLDGGVEDRPIGGLGVHLVRTLMDRVSYERVAGHNRLTLLKRVQLQPPGASPLLG